MPVRSLGRSSVLAKLIDTVATEAMFICSPDVKDPEERFKTLEPYWILLKQDIGSYGIASFDLNEAGKVAFKSAEHWMKLAKATYGITETLD